MFMSDRVGYSANKILQTLETNNFEGLLKYFGCPKYRGVFNSERHCAQHLKSDGLIVSLDNVQLQQYNGISSEFFIKTFIYLYDHLTTHQCILFQHANNFKGLSQRNMLFVTFSKYGQGGKVLKGNGFVVTVVTLFIVFLMKNSISFKNNFLLGYLFLKL